MIVPTANDIKIGQKYILRVLGGWHNEPHIFDGIEVSVVEMDISWLITLRATKAPYPQGSKIISTSTMGYGATYQLEELNCPKSKELC